MWPTREWPPCSAVSEDTMCKLTNESTERQCGQQGSDSAVSGDMMCKFTNKSTERQCGQQGSDPRVQLCQGIWYVSSPTMLVNLQSTERQCDQQGSDSAVSGDTMCKFTHKSTDRQCGQQGSDSCVQLCQGIRLWCVSLNTNKSTVRQCGQQGSDSRVHLCQGIWCVSLNTNKSTERQYGQTREWFPCSAVSEDMINLNKFPIYFCYYAVGSPKLKEDRTFIQIAMSPVYLCRVRGTCHALSPPPPENKLVCK